jgi:transposase
MKEPQMKCTTIGLDIAKHVLQAHAVEIGSGEVTRTKLRRGEVLAFFAQLHPSVIAMEACGAAHHWARSFAKLGHQVRLIAPQFVRPFVKTNKNDAADAQAIWTAAQQPEMRFVAIKTEEQQAALALHAIRERLKKSRTAAVNQIHGLMGEFGLVLAKGWRTMLPKAAAALDDSTSIVPALLRPQLRHQLEEIHTLTAKITDVERQIASWQRQQDGCERIAAIPGVGLLTATAAVATIGEASTFRSGRQFAAYLGLVPRQSGTGGRVQLLGISKRGDTYLRTLLIHGARGVLANSRAAKDPNTWVGRLIQRRHHNVAAVALANKMARQIWALLAHQRRYDPKQGSMGPLSAAAP